MLTKILVGVVVVVILAALIYTMVLNAKIKKSGIEADAVVSRIKENESTDSDGSLSVSYEYYVQYYTQSGELVEAKLGNPPYDLIQGTQLRIKYLPEKPNYAIFVK